MLKSKHALTIIKCDFPECGKEFDNVQQWAEHYNTHSGGIGDLDLYAISQLMRNQRSKHDVMVEAIKTRPELVEKGLRIVDKEVAIWKGRVDLIGIDSNRRLCVIDVTLGKSISCKKRKMLQYRFWLQRLAMRVFGLERPLVRLFIATPGGVIEIA